MTSKLCLGCRQVLSVLKFAQGNGLFGLNDECKNCQDDLQVTSYKIILYPVIGNRKKQISEWSVKDCASVFSQLGD